MVPSDVVELFSSTYGVEPDVVASAPGRVNLIGEHTDYNGGEVLPMAIGQRTRVAMRLRTPADKSRLISSTEKDTGEFISPYPARSGRWWDYVSGHVAAHPELPTVDVAVTSDVPAGAGLSSSAALEVASGLAYDVMTGSTRPLRDIAIDAWKVETTFVGVSCGIMDQFASALSRAGHALHIRCDTAETGYVPFRFFVLIFDTAVPRSLRTSAFNLRQQECQQALDLLREANPALETLAAAEIDEIKARGLPQLLEARAIHVSSETRRVRAAVTQLRKKGTIDGSLLYESHLSLRDNYDCSSPELDWFVDRISSFPGIEGARLTGAGWGGCAIALGSESSLSAARDAIAGDYERAFSRVPRIWITEASAGAAIDFSR